MPEEKTPTFCEKFEREVEQALKAAPPHATIVCIADGSRSIWKYFENHAKLKKAIHVLDFWHAAEHLSHASDALFGQGTATAQRWFKKYRTCLKTEDNGVDKVIRSIRYYKQHLSKRSSRRHEEVRRVLGYFTRNRSRMQYAEYRKKAIPIGSGVVEAACKTLIGHRLKMAGMRWSLEGGQSILNLRAAVLSGRWDAFWESHQEVLGAVRIAA